MLDDFSLEALIEYAEAHPLIGVLLLVAAVVVLGSLLRKVFKIAVVCAVVLLVGLYFTHSDAPDWWKQVEAVGSEVVVWGEELLEWAGEIFEQAKQELGGN